jgi:hypothetical protein
MKSGHPPTLYKIPQLFGAPDIPHIGSSIVSHIMESATDVNPQHSDAAVAGPSVAGPSPSVPGPSVPGPSGAVVDSPQSVTPSEPRHLAADDPVLVTPAAIVNSVVDRFLTELAEMLPNIKPDGPCRISFPCFASNDIVPVILRRIKNLLPGQLVLLESTVSMDRRSTTFHFVLRRTTEAEVLMSQLLAMAGWRLDKALSFSEDVQQLSWVMRNVKEITWSMFEKKSDAASADGDTTEGDGEGASGDAEPAEPEAEPEKGKLALLLARYRAAHGFHNVLGRLHHRRGYENYYPLLPCVSEDSLPHLRQYPDAKEAIRRYDEQGDHLSGWALLDKDIDRERAYVFIREDDDVSDDKQGPSVARAGEVMTFIIC